MPDRLAAGLLAAVLIIASASVVAAQSGVAGPGSPEGLDWRLTSYPGDGGPVAVPPAVDASMRLDDGTVTGSGGCNRFSGSYALDGPALSFPGQLLQTLRACTGDADEVEAAYLAALPEVAGWAVDAGDLALVDGDGSTLLTFVPAGGTPPGGELAAVVERLDRLEAGLASLDADLGALDARIDSIRIGALRERISALEAESARLREQLTQLQASTDPPSRERSRFDAAERVLLEGVPKRIADRCRPLRERLPSGTIAAVECSPNTSVVSEMAYYLFELPDAMTLFEDRMEAYDVEQLGNMYTPDTRTCADGAASAILAGSDNYFALLGCYVDAGRANLRLVERATDCRQLKAGGRTIKRPAMYVAMTGANDDIARLYDWSMRGKTRTRASGTVVSIERPNARKAPGCVVN